LCNHFVANNLCMKRRGTLRTNSVRTTGSFKCTNTYHASNWMTTKTVIPGKLRWCLYLMYQSRTNDLNIQMYDLFPLLRNHNRAYVSQIFVCGSLFCCNQQGILTNFDQSRNWANWEYSNSSIKLGELELSEWGPNRGRMWYVNNGNTFSANVEIQSGSIENGSMVRDREQFVNKIKK
jgi:hypothetical protein